MTHVLIFNKNLDINLQFLYLDNENLTNLINLQDLNAIHLTV